MQWDIVLPNESPTMPVRALDELARQAEEVGFETAFLPDHILPPGEYGATFGGVYEPMVTIAHLAASTQRIRFGTSVLVLPLRNPFVLAKQVGSLQRLTDDRIILGVGTGWVREEFDGVGVEFGRRGAITDDTLAVLRHLFTEGSGPYAGRRFGFDTGYFEPRPATPVPIMVGGNSDAALRRAARFADRWQGLPVPPEQFAERVAGLAALDAERAVSPGVRIGWDDDRQIEQVVQEIEAYRDAGAEHLAIHLGEWRDYPKRMAELAAVMPRP